MSGEQLLAFIRQIDRLAETTVGALMEPLAEFDDAFDALEEIRDICEAVERDVLSDLMAPRTA